MRSAFSFIISVLAAALIASGAVAGGSVFAAGPEPAQSPASGDAPAKSAKSATSAKMAKMEGKAKAPAAAKDAKTKPKRGVGPAGGGPGPAEVTLEGDLTCAKCGLHESAQCQSVLVVKDQGKDVKYYLTRNAAADAQHEKVCGGSVPATITGTVTEEGGRKLLTASVVTAK